MEKCEHCKAENPAFVRPVAVMKETPYAAPAETYTPPVSQTSAKISSTTSFFTYANLPGKIILIMLFPISACFLYILSNKGLVTSCFYSVGAGGAGAAFVLMLVLFGPLCAFWGVRGFMALNSPTRGMSWVLWAILQIIQFICFSKNVPGV